MKKILLAGYLLAGVLMIGGCAEKNVNTTSVTMEETTAVTTYARETTATVETTEMEIPQESSAPVVTQEAKDFAVSIKEVVAQKDMEKLVDLLNLPTYVEVGTGLEITSREQFLALDPEEVFTDGLVNAIAQVDVESLIMVEAGVVMGEGTPNIIFNETEDGFGIMGINQ